jgi:hypothetical protein
MIVASAQHCAPCCPPPTSPSGDGTKPGPDFAAVLATFEALLYQKNKAATKQMELCKELEEHIGETREKMHALLDLAQAALGVGRDKHEPIGRHDTAPANMHNRHMFLATCNMSTTRQRQRKDCNTRCCILLLLVCWPAGA